MAITAPNSVSEQKETASAEAAAKKPSHGQDRPGMDLGGSSDRRSASVGSDAQEGAGPGPAGHEAGTAESIDTLRR